MLLLVEVMSTRVRSIHGDEEGVPGRLVQIVDIAKVRDEIPTENDS